MKLKTNPRGNGACPLCRKDKKCKLQDALKDSVSGFLPVEESFEIVIYICPEFEEE